MSTDPRETEKDSSDHYNLMFWKDVIYKDGKIDEEQVMKELLDYSDMMHRFGCFLGSATGGRMSKLNYTVGAMESCLNEHIEDCVNDALEEERENPQPPK